MSFEPYPLKQPRVAVRWTFWDLLLVAGIALALGGIVTLLLRFAQAWGFVDVRAFFATRPVLAVVTSVAILDSAMALAAILVIIVRRRGTWREIGFRPPPLLPMLLTPLVFAGELVVMLVINMIIFFATGQFDNPQRDLFLDPNGFSWANFVFAFIAAAIVAPIIEELVFRGLLYQWLRDRTNVAIGVVASAAFFAALHGIPAAFPALFVVSAVWALMFEWSKSLWVPITLHFFQNAFVVSLIFFVQANPQLFQQA